MYGIHYGFSWHKKPAVWETAGRDEILKPFIAALRED